MKKPLFLVLGTLAVLIGIVGVVVPGLPTTPFLLIAAWLYGRSSNRLRQKLVNHRFLGGYIREYQQGLSLRTKIHAISLMWAMILLSVFAFVHDNRIKAIIVAVGIIGTLVMGRLPGPKKE